MNEVQHERTHEQQANAEYAWQATTKFFGHHEAISEDEVKRIVYKYTSCGAWVKVNEKAQITFGSIVEGSDAEFTCDPIDTAEREQSDIEADITQALEWLEEKTDEAWREANGDSAGHYDFDPDGRTIYDCSDYMIIAELSDDAMPRQGRMLAAAPELLDALEVAESFIAGFEDDETQECIDDLLLAVRGAIAKAKGAA